MKYHQLREKIMQKIKFIFIIFLVFVFSCEKQSTDLGTNLNPIGKMALQIDMTQAPAEIVKIIGTLSRNGYEDIIFHFDIEDDSATALVEDLAQGTWKLRVDAYNNTDVIIYTGSTEVNVISGTTTPVHLQLNPASGSIYITVDWGDSGREWGEIVNGIRISINLDDQKLVPYDQSYSNILIENVSADSITFEAYVFFALYDNLNFFRYAAVFNLNAADPTEGFHTKSIISFKESNTINRTLEITQLGWVLSVSSRPPDITEFYKVIESGQYNLELVIEPVGGTFFTQKIHSNQIPVNIKSAASEIDYQIYSVVIDSMYNYRSPYQIVICDSTVYWDLKDNNDYVFEHFPSISKETVKNYQIINSISVQLLKVPDVAVECFLITPEDRSKWKQLFPDANVLIHLSRVGFNSDYNQALLYISDYYAPLAGAGFLVYLEKQKKWVIKQTLMIWIS